MVRQELFILFKFMYVHSAIKLAPIENERVAIGVIWAAGREFSIEGRKGDTMQGHGISLSGNFLGILSIYIKLTMSVCT